MVEGIHFQKLISLKHTECALLTITLEYEDKSCLKVWKKITEFYFYPDKQSLSGFQEEWDNKEAIARDFFIRSSCPHIKPTD